MSVASVDLGSGQTIMISENILVCNHLRYNDLCSEQLHLFPEDEIDLKEGDQSAEHGAILKPHYGRAVDYLSHAVTQLISLRAVETFEQRMQVDCVHVATSDPLGALLSFLLRLQRETLKDPFRDSGIFNHTRNPVVASQPITVLLKALYLLNRHTSTNSGMPKFNLVIDALPWSFLMHGFGSL